MNLTKHQAALGSGDNVQHSVQIDAPAAQQRRSTRIVQAVPVAVTGVDALGRPFQEHTSTLVLNSHGCRYQSRHYVLKHMWVTLEVPNPQAGYEPRRVRARVMWIRRPRSVRELFHVGVELEKSGNIWGIAFPPADWTVFNVDSEFAIHIAAASPLRTVQDAADPEHEDNLRTMPHHAHEPSGILATQMDRLVHDAKQQLHAAIRESAAEAVSAEARPLIAALQAQLQDVAHFAFGSASADREPNRVIQPTAGESAESATFERSHGDPGAAADIPEQALQELRQRWDGELHDSIERAGEEFQSRLNEIAGKCDAAFERQMESRTRESEDSLQRIADDISANMAHGQESLEQFRKALNERFAVCVDDTEQKIRFEAEKSRARVSEIKRAAEELQADVACMLSSAQSEWRARLDASLADATGQWHEQIETSIESAVERAAHQIIGHSQHSSAELDEMMRLRVNTIRETFADLTADAESKLGTLRGALDQGMTQAQEALGNASVLSRNFEEQSASLASAFELNVDKVTRTAQQDLETHGSAILEKVQDQMQLASARCLEETSAALRQKAGEISSLFADLETQIKHSAGEFRAAIAVQTEQAVTTVASRVSGHTASLQEMLQAAEQTAQRDFRSTLESLGDQFAEAYKKRLEQTSDQWLPVVLEKLNQRTQHQLDGLAQSAESRLNQTCGQVFSNLGDILRSRFSDLSVPSSDTIEEKLSHS
jgi:hypothetical protein